MGLIMTNIPQVAVRINWYNTCDVLRAVAGAEKVPRILQLVLNKAN